MPHPHHTTTGGRAGLDPVPVAVLLPPPAPAGTGTSSRSVVPAGRGLLSPHAACQVVAVYTRPGELVADVEADPAVAAAAGWLDRPHRVITGHGWATGVRGGVLPPRRARLLVAALPRPGAARLTALADWFRYARSRLVVPGGYLLTPITTDPSSRSGRHRCADHATTVVAAARAAGWAWQQHLIDVTEPLPEHAPTTETSTAAEAAEVGAGRVGRGRHRVVHQELLVFTTAGIRDA